MSNVGLLFVGAVLVVNGLALLGRVDARSGAILNFLVGALTLAIALHAGFTGDTFTAAKLLLFAFTYLWVAYNAWARVDDGRAFGWYCLFVAVVALPIAAITFDDGDGWFGLFWTSWGLLWLLYFFILALGASRLTRFAGVVTLAIAVGTCVLPGFLLVSGKWEG